MPIDQEAANDQRSIGISRKEAKQALALLAHLRQICRTAIRPDGKFHRPVAMDQADLIIASVSLRVLMFDEEPLLLTFAQKHGMTPAQAIRAATFNAADLIGRSTDVGTLEAGKYADIIAVDADPMADVRALEHVSFVMKGGAVVRDAHTAPAP